MPATQEQIKVLKECYTIHGDGQARLNLKEALKDEKFLDMLKHMNELTTEQIEDGVK